MYKVLVQFSVLVALVAAAAGDRFHETFERYFLSLFVVLFVAGSWGGSYIPSSGFMNFVCRDLAEIVGRGTGNRRTSVYTLQHRHREKHIHSCYEWDSNPRFQFLEAEDSTRLCQSIPHDRRFYVRQHKL
jgi:hypothetical protein